MHAYIAIGVDAYAAITASLSAYRSLVEESGTQSLALAAAARDALATAPRFVAGVNLAFGTAIIGASHAAIQADTMLAYWLAEAAPRRPRHSRASRRNGRFARPWRYSRTRARHHPSSCAHRGPRSPRSCARQRCL